MSLEKKIKSDIKKILKPYTEYLDEFNRVFSESMISNVKIVDTVAKYLVKRKGKQFRPILVILSALASGEWSSDVYKAATVVELLHTATLVHDDVIDDSDTRRGFPAVHAVWKNRIAILMGDYLLAKSLIIATETGQLRMMNIVSNVAKEMSQGELLQIDKARKLNISEEEYFQLISGKTASLISASCEIGSLIAGANESICSALRKFGLLLGQAFQIQDDLLDYSGNSSILGKPVIGDLKEKKITLPLLYTFNHLSESEIKKIKKFIKKGIDSNSADYIIQTVRETGGYNEALTKAAMLVNEAIEQIQILPETEHKQSLQAIAKYVINRQK